MSNESPTRQFIYRPPPEEIIKSVDDFMLEEGRKDLDVKLSARTLCGGPTHRGLFGRLKPYDITDQFGAVISNGEQLIDCMIGIVNQEYRLHKAESPYCEAKPKITLTASIEGIESSTLRF